MKSLLSMLILNLPEKGSPCGNYIPRVGDVLYTSSMRGKYLITKRIDNKLYAIYTQDDAKSEESYHISCWCGCMYYSSGNKL